MRLRFTYRATDDLQRLRAFIANDNPLAARRSVRVNARQQPSRPTSWIGNSGRAAPIRSGSLTSPTSGPPKAGSTSPSCSTCIRAAPWRWSMQSDMTSQLVTDALMLAVWRRGKPYALLHHSDRGSQYTSDAFQGLLGDIDVICSMSRSGNVWDNSAMENFFSSLKTERTARTVYRYRSDANADVFDYIERFYSPTRLHSTLGYLSPIQYQQQTRLA